jgi:peptidyl-prolyl cis-trans isomerase B (cyclophilin B)
MTTFSPESRAVLKTSMGDITIAFLVDKAPRTCEHFVRLARQGFYDGLTFHRVIKDFIVQGGCPRGDGSGGPGFTLRAEFNDTPHVRGVVSMARGTDPHSAGSQFFIVHGDAPYLDSRYTAFARVVEGLDVVDKLANVPVTENRFRELSTPRDPVFINRIVLEGVEFDANDLAAGAATAGGGAGAGSGGGAAAGEGPAAAPQMGAPPAAGGEEPDDGDEGEDGDDDGGAGTEGDEARGEAGHAVSETGGGVEGESERGDGERGEGEGDGEAEGTEAPAPREAGRTRSAGGTKNGGNGARRGGRRRRSRRGRSGGTGGGSGGGGAGG